MPSLIMVCVSIVIAFAFVKLILKPKLDKQTKAEFQNKD